MNFILGLIILVLLIIIVAQKLKQNNEIYDKTYQKTTEVISNANENKETSSVQAKPKISSESLKKVDERVKQRENAIKFIKGDIGELEIEKEVIRWCFKVNHIFKNVKIANTEIDLLLISNKGLFVIESKNITGQIEINNGIWTADGVEFGSGSPIEQNKRHIKCLSDKLKLSENVFYNIIIFGRNTQIDKVIKKGDNFAIFKLGDEEKFTKHINAIIDEKSACFNQEQIQNIVDEIKCLSNYQENLNRTQYIEFIKSSR